PAAASARPRRGPRRQVPRFVRRLLTLVAIGAVIAASVPGVTLAALNLTITTPYPAVTVAPGSKVSFDLSVRSSERARVDLNLGGVPTGWTATLHGGGFLVDVVQTSGSGVADVRLDVAFPADTMLSTYHMS